LNTDMASECNYIWLYRGRNGMGLCFGPWGGIEIED